MGTDKIPATSDKLTSMLLVEIHNKLIDIENKLTKNDEKKLVGDVSLAVSSKDVKGQKAFPKGLIERKIYDNYYDSNNTITNIQLTNPNDEDHPNYNRERIFESLERNAELLYVANDGIYTMYAIASHAGGQSFTRERPIYPGEIKLYYNIYEIRLRCETAGNPYRVTEYDIDTSCCPIRSTVLNNLSTPVVNFTRTLGLGSGSSAIINYAVTGNFKLTLIEASASGSLKIEVKTGNVDNEVTRLIAFTTPSNLTAQLTFNEELQLLAGQRLQIILTNRELQAMDTFNTIFGFNS